MATTLNEILSRLPASRREKILAQAEKLIVEEMSIRDLRKALKLTQKHMAKALNIGQDSVSRIEQRSDVLYSTLKKYIQAMGGDLHLIANFPNRPPVEITGLSELENRRK